MELKKNPSKDVYRKSGLFFFFGLCVSVLLIIIAFEWLTVKPIATTNCPPAPDDNWVSAMTVSSVTIIPAPAQQPAVKKMTSPVFVTSNEAPERSEEIDPETFTDDRPQPFLLPPAEPEAETDSSEFFIFVETMPKPLGGYDSLYQFFSKEMKYPRAATRNQVYGRVFVEFVIDKKGVPTEIKSIKGIGYGCDEEAARVIALTKWNPGKQRGKPVKVKMVLPVQFKIN